MTRIRKRPVTVNDITVRVPRGSAVDDNTEGYGLLDHIPQSIDQGYGIWFALDTIESYLEHGIFNTSEDGFEWSYDHNQAGEGDIDSISMEFGPINIGDQLVERYPIKITFIIEG